MAGQSSDSARKCWSRTQLDDLPAVRVAAVEHHCRARKHCILLLHWLAEIHGFDKPAACSPTGRAQPGRATCDQMCCVASEFNRHLVGTLEQCETTRCNSAHHQVVDIPLVGVQVQYFEQGWQISPH